MVLLREIDKWISRFYELVESNSLSEEELIHTIREQSGTSSLLFSFLVERILFWGLEKNKIIVSKALLKNYLNTKFKDHKDYLYYGSGENNSDEEVEDGIYLKKGVFIRVVEKLSLVKTKSTYIKYLFSDPEFDHKEYAVKKDDVIRVLFNEIGEKNIHVAKL